MTTAIKRRRGTTAEHSTFIGLEGEITIDSTKDTVVVHDGATAGGFPLAKENMTGNLTFTDNAKAIFGAGSDLQIYHDGTTSKIDGAVTLTSNVTLGDASTDTVTVNGYMGVGGAPSTNYGLRVRGDVTGSTISYGLASTGTVKSDVTNIAIGVSTGLGTEAAAFTVGQIRQINVGEGTKGAGSTVTNNHGLYISDLSNGTNNYGITSTVSSGTNKWNIYASGTAANYFAGNVGIGASSPATKLHLKLAGSSDGFISESSSNDDFIKVAHDGTVGYISTSYLSTGGYTPLVFKTSNTERLRLSTTEAVFNDPGNDYDFRIESDTNSHAFFLEGSTGNVGIGTSSPTLITAGSRVLEVSGAGDYFPSINLARTGATGYTNVNWKQFLSSNGGLYFRQNSTDRLVIDSAGNLGLGVAPSFGTTSGVAAFQVKNASLYGYLNASYQAANLYLDAGTTKFIASAPASYYYQNSGAHSWHISTNATPTAGNAITFTQAMTLDASGNLAVGNTTATSRANIWGANVATGANVSSSNGQLAVYSTTTYGADIGGTIALGGDGGTYHNVTYATISGRKANASVNNYDAYLAFAVAKDTSNAVVERARIDSSGNLLVGTTTVNSAVDANTVQAVISGNSQLYVTHVTGTASGIYYHTFSYGGSVIGSITQNGTTGVSYNTSSDYRLKEDWQPMVGASERVKALKPVNFAWKADGSRVDGFLAHEAQAVVPEAVTGEKDAVDADGNPEYQGIDQSKLVPLLTAALQEALAQIESLTARVSALEGN